MKTIIGLAASGNTKFTSSILKEAKVKDCLIIAISNNPKVVLKHANYKLVVDTGPELVAGSTRLKAGTSQKVLLNLISTLVMTKLGYVKKGLMINMVATNKKLLEKKIYKST